jgi:hypothetical protein
MAKERISRSKQPLVVKALLNQLLDLEAYDFNFQLANRPNHWMVIAVEAPDKPLTFRDLPRPVALMLVANDQETTQTLGILRKRFKEEINAERLRTAPQVTRATLPDDALRVLRVWWMIEQKGYTAL